MQAITLAPDGRHLLVVTHPQGDFNIGSLWLWDLHQRKQVGPRLAALGGHAQPQITPTGTRAILAGAHTLVSVDLDPTNWQKSLCRFANRRLTTTEWRTTAPNERYPASCSTP